MAATKGSVTFQQLWDNYPWGDPFIDPRTGSPPPGYDDQCAIKISVTLHRVGVQMLNYHGTDRLLVGGLPTAAQADQLATWLLKTPISGIGVAQNVTGKDWRSKIGGRKGIIEFSGYWPRNPNRPNDRNGSHITLWNGHRLTVTSAMEGTEFLGRSLGIDEFVQFRKIPVLNQVNYHDYAMSKRILFWPVSQ